MAFPETTFHSILFTRCVSHIIRFVEAVLVLFRMSEVLEKLEYCFTEFYRNLFLIGSPEFLNIRRNFLLCVSHKPFVCPFSVQYVNHCFSTNLKRTFLPVSTSFQTPYSNSLIDTYKRIEFIWLMITISPIQMLFLSQSFVGGEYSLW